MTEAQRIALVLANASGQPGVGGATAGRAVAGLAGLLRLAPLGLALLASVSAHALLLSWFPETVITISAGDIGQAGIRVALVSSSGGGNSLLEAGEVEEGVAGGEERVSRMRREAHQPASARVDLPGDLVTDSPGDAGQQLAATPVLVAPAKLMVAGPGPLCQYR